MRVKQSQCAVGQQYGSTGYSCTAGYSCTGTAVQQYGVQLYWDSSTAVRGTAVLGQQYHSTGYSCTGTAVQQYRGTTILGQQYRSTGYSCNLSQRDKASQATTPEDSYFFMENMSCLRQDSNP